MTPVRYSPPTYNIAIIKTKAKTSLKRVVKKQRDYRSGLHDLRSVAAQDALVELYREAVYRYDTLCAARNGALGYAVAASEYPDYQAKVAAATLARRTLRCTSDGQVPHPNEYLSEEQRGVLVLLDRLEKEEA